MTKLSSTLVLFLFGLILWDIGLAQNLSERTYKRLTKIHVYMSNNEYDKALSDLNALLPSVKRKNYEYALVLQTFGYLYSSQEQYKRAIPYFKQCLDLNALPEEPQKSTMYSLAQLYMATSDFLSAVETLEKWFKLEKNPKPEAKAFAGMAYAQLKRYPQAIKYLNAAIKQAEKPQETWYQILLSIYFDQKNYNKSAEVLQILITAYPNKKDYWLQLSGIYFTLKNDKKSLAVMELAYKKGFLTSGKEQVNLANMYLLLDIPIKAAKILDSGIKSEIIEGTQKNWQLLSDAYLRAKELTPALYALRKAANLSDNGELYVRCAQISAEQEDWDAVIKDLEAAKNKGDLKRPDKLYLLLGNAYYEKKQFDTAIQTFRMAKKHSKSKKLAQQWIDHIIREQAIVGS